MANDNHAAQLMKGVAAWNAWRDENPNIHPDLSGAHLIGADLRGAKLFEADLIRAKLNEANLLGANLSGAAGARIYRPSPCPSARVDEWRFSRPRPGLL
jgi:uncharacterized protein YjbI with pentapeptide repeats